MQLMSKKDSVIALRLQVEAAKAPLLRKAADKLLNESKFSSLRREMDAFRAENPWVEDSALFFCLIEYQVKTCPTNATAGQCLSTSAQSFYVAMLVVV